MLTGGMWWLVVVAKGGREFCVCPFTEEEYASHEAGSAGDIIRPAFDAVTERLEGRFGLEVVGHFFARRGR